MHLKQLDRISRSDEPDQYALFTRIAIIKSVNVAGFRLCDQFTTTLCQKIMVNQPDLCYYEICLLISSTQPETLLYLHRYDNRSHPAMLSVFYRNCCSHHSFPPLYCLICRYLHFCLLQWRSRIILSHNAVKTAVKNNPWKIILLVLVDHVADCTQIIGHLINILCHCKIGHYPVQRIFPGSQNLSAQLQP